MPDPQALPVPTGPVPGRLLEALTRMLGGAGPLLVPYPADAAPPDLGPVRPADALASGAAAADATRGATMAGIAIGTSGSTGTPKRAVLSHAALTASAAATHERLGGRGRWLLALPAHHIAGLQVVLRSLAAGTTPVVLDPGPFTVDRFAAATDRLDRARMTAGPARRYVSLVPTQVTRLLADPAGRAALASYDAVLVGGAHVPATLVAEAAEAGARLVTTYGMSETAGGCVYDGTPLRGVRTMVEAADGGRVWLAGAVLATGYLGDPGRSAASFVRDSAGTTWFRTDDVGRYDADGHLVIDGRIDDVIITGGQKVAPSVVEQAIAAILPEAGPVVALAVPDPDWGQVVAVALTRPNGGADRDGQAAASGAATPTLETLRSSLRDRLPRYALPRRLVVLDEIPVLGPGKPDRARLRAVFQDTVRQ